MLFRPEEVVLPSGAAPVHHRLRWTHPNKPAMVHLNVDPLHAVGTRVVQGDWLILVLAADQQQKVHRSRHAEPFSSVKRDGVKREPQALKELFVAFGQRISG